MMMEQTQKASLSMKRLLMLMLLYFIGFTILLPYLLKNITLWLDPNAYIMNIPILLFSYLMVMMLAIYIDLPVWKHSVQSFLKNKKKCIRMIAICIVIILVINFALSTLISILTQTENSQNQEAVIENARISPIYSFLYTCMIAPILEETIFRGGIFTYIRKHGGFLGAFIISSFLFGFIHVMKSFSIGNLSDFAYLFVYTGIGLVLAASYDKSDSIFVSIGIHAGNNLVAFLLMLL